MFTIDRFRFMQKKVTRVRNQEKNTFCLSYLKKYISPEIDEIILIE